MVSNKVEPSPASLSLLLSLSLQKQRIIILTAHNVHTASPSCQPTSHRRLVGIPAKGSSKEKRKNKNIMCLGRSSRRNDDRYASRWLALLKQDNCPPSQYLHRACQLLAFSEKPLARLLPVQL
ncbi:hypothetical protein CDEST_10472 [Colletotrichum destructivum]|uniref:Uncharacterized protein n=1 Tax=Colletotrichum destructivum TaxID=34406 RepID=A0AAX4IPI9_9PEZI|nr:hypothetical protein CDEST_10472 [Colletotrichum destructivum]